MEPGDNKAAASEELNQASSLKDMDTFPCESCGGHMTFDPQKDALVCAYCGNEQEITIQAGEIKEYDFATTEKDQGTDWGRENNVIKCENCGAETVVDTYGTAHICAFCGSPNIAQIEQTPGIPPESLIQFKIDEKKAMESFTQWIKSRFFAPSALKNNYSAQRIKGVYVPYWTYDSQTYSTYTAEGGTHYYVTETYTTQENGKQVTKTRQVRHTRWWPTSGLYSKFFDDVLVSASTQLDEGLISGIEPFDLTELIKYAPEYLSGFYAERYSIGLEEGWKTAVKIITEKIQPDIIKKINADEVRNLQINTDHRDVKFKHLLLPIWISAYTYKQKVYKFMVNGQTGKVSGKAPVSPLKITLIAAIVVAIAVLVYFLFFRGQ